MNLQTVLPALNRLIKGIGTYIPRYLAVDSAEPTFSTDPEEWLESCGVKGPLQVHVFNMEMKISTFFDPLYCEVKPGPRNMRMIFNLSHLPEASVLVIGH